MSIPMVTRKVSFRPPTVGARDYVAIDGSGWATVFPKQDADNSLMEAIGDVPLDELTTNFQELLALRPERLCSWTDVTRYLARVLDMDADMIPCKIGIAFWAHMRQLDKSAKKGKPCVKECT